MLFNHAPSSAYVTIRRIITNGKLCFEALRKPTRNMSNMRTFSLDSNPIHSDRVLVLHHCGPGTIPGLSYVFNRPSFDQTAGNCSASYTQARSHIQTHSSLYVRMGVTQRKQLKYYLLYYSALKHHVGHLAINY
jgi:hypothetical protein